MTVLTAALPVGEAIFGLLQDASLQSALGGRLADELPESPSYPCGFYEFLSETDQRGLGQGGLPELDLRTHVFSKIGSLSQARAIDMQIVALLKDALITVTGYAQCGRIVYRETVTLRDQEMNGDRVHEVCSLFTVWVEQN